MHTLGLVSVLILSFVAPAETKLGAGVTLEESTPIATIVADPEAFVGKTVRIDGVATAVCTHMGCWMSVAASDQPNAPSVRLKVDDGVIVFPVRAKGKRVSAEGVYEAVADAESKEAAGEHARHDARASKQYQLKATGALVH